METYILGLLALWEPWEVGELVEFSFSYFQKRYTKKVHPKLEVILSRIGRKLRRQCSASLEHFSMVIIMLI